MGGGFVFTRLLALLLLFSGPAVAQMVAIRAGNLVDPATGSVAKNQIILVRGGKIVEVGPGVQIPPGAEVVDLSNAWVMPGLMDAHTHLTLGGRRIIKKKTEYMRETSGMRLLRENR